MAVPPAYGTANHTSSLTPMARPARSASGNSTALIKISVSPEEKEQIKALAGERSLSEYLRQAGLQSRRQAVDIPGVCRDLYSALPELVLFLENLLNVCEQLLMDDRVKDLPADPNEIVDQLFQLQDMRTQLIALGIDTGELEPGELEP